jgi:AGZA family xanthine/uracil permease-like MFS transporter
MGGRIGYSAATGIAVILMCWFGVISVMLALIPSVAILPILLYIGMLIGSQAFQETPRSHAPAIVLSITPHLANWALSLINGALAAAGITVAALGASQMGDLVAKMKDQGVLYRGLQILGGGSILGGLILGAIAVCVIDRNFKKAAGFALAGTILTFFGFMHGERIGFAQSPVVAFSYAAVAALMVVCAKFAVVTAQPNETVEHLAAVSASVGSSAVPNV